MDFEYDSYPSWKKMVLIAKLVYGDKSQKEIANLIGESVTNKHFRQILQYLEDEDYCFVDKSRSPWLYRINNKKLAISLRDLEPFKLSEDIIELTMVGLARY